MAERKKKLLNRHVFSDEELEEPPQGQVLERVKSDRMIASISVDEDRRRRTIIVEKKKGSYGFTLQSYGIHYKKEQEVEMLTYVDSVEYDGPAYRAGMREGDVILSINGTDMENADHKTLVNFIKSCESRMRMVVLFENCVRKVELHIRYIQLQEILQNKMAQLEKICLKEKEVLDNKWKTRSLPASARKKATTDSTTELLASPSDPEGSNFPYTRPLSTEDVAKLTKQNNSIIPPPAQFILAYQYMDPHQKQFFKSSTPSSSGEYLVSNASLNCTHPTFSGNEINSYSSLSNQQSPSQRSHHHHHVPDHSHGDFNNISQNANDEQNPKLSKSRRHYHGHSCNPCMGHFISKRDKSNDKACDKDNTSLDAYDLASPCCGEPNCVPVKRRSRHHKEHHHKHKHRDKERPPRPKSQSHASPQMQAAANYENSVKQERRLSNACNLSAQMANHCNLHSCNPNEYSQHTSSMSTDTLWDPNSEPNNRQSVKHQRPNSVYQQPAATQHSYRYVHPSQVQPVKSSIAATHAYMQPTYTTKPKSWDNLAMKGCGGFTYGYVTCDSTGKAPMISGQSQALQQARAPPLPKKTSHAPYGRYSAFADMEHIIPAPPAYIQESTITKTTIITTKSTENLISNAQYNHSDGSCECVAQPSPKMTKQIIASNCVACQAANNDNGTYQGYYSTITRNNSNHCIIPTKSEITRL